MTYKIQNDISLLEKKIRSQESRISFSSKDWQIDEVVQRIIAHKDLLKVDSTSAIQISSLIQRVHTILNKATEDSATKIRTTLSSYDFPAPPLEGTTFRPNNLPPLIQLEEELLSKDIISNILTSRPLPPLNKKYLNNILEKHKSDPIITSKVIEIFLNEHAANQSKAMNDSPNENTMLDFLDRVLSKHKNTKQETLPHILTLAIHLKNALVSETTIAEILEAIEDIPQENTEFLFDILVQLKKEGINENTLVNITTVLQSAPTKNLKELSSLALHLYKASIRGQTLIDVLTKLKDTSPNTLKELSDMVSHLKYAGLAGRIILNIAIKIKDSLPEIIKKLSTIAVDLKNYKLDDYQIAAVLVSLKDTPNDQLESLYTLLKELTSFEIKNHSISDLLAELKDVPSDALSVFHTSLVSLKNKGLQETCLELQSLTLADKQTLHNNLLRLKEDNLFIQDGWTADIILLAYSLEEPLDETKEFAYDLLKSKFDAIDINKVLELPDASKIKLVRELMFDISFSNAQILEPVKILLKSIPHFNAEKFIESLLHALQNLSLLTQNDLNNILSNESLRDFKKNFRLLSNLEGGVDVAYATYKSELLKEKYNYLHINKPNTFPNRYNTQTIPGLAIMANRLMQKNKFTGLFVCANHQAIANKLNEINKDPKDQRCALVISHDSFGDEIPNHKISICIEKKDGFLHLFFMDSVGLQSPSVYNKIERMLQGLKNPNYELTFCGFSREKGVYGCEIFALHDSKNFLQDPDFMQKIVIKNKRGKSVIVELPPQFMLPTQDIPLLTSYIKERPSRADIVFPETKKTLRDSTTKHMSTKAGTLRNEYISKKTIKYMHFVTSCLKTLPKEKIQAIIKQTLLT